MNPAMLIQLRIQINKMRAMVYETQGQFDACVASLDSETLTAIHDTEQVMINDYFRDNDGPITRIKFLRQLYGWDLVACRKFIEQWEDDNQ